MKKLLYFAFFMNFAFFGAVNAETISIDWMVDDNTYSQTTCETGNDLIIPTPPPTKRGYTFLGWKIKLSASIEYLESTGTQWIDTGIAPSRLSDNIILVVDGNYTEWYALDSAAIIGTMGAGWFKMDLKSSTILGFQCSGVSQETRVSVTNTLDRHLLKMDTGTGKCYLDEAEYNLNVLKDTLNINSNFTLFKANGASSSQYAKARIYSAQIYDNNVLIRDFIPVFDNNGTPCMYDKVTQQFFYNAGTGDFIAGPIINE